MPASQNPDQRIFDRRRIVQALIVLPLAAASLAGCANMEVRPADAPRPPSHITGGGGPGGGGGRN